MSTESATKTETESAACCSTCGPCHQLGFIYGALLLRLWLAVRAIQTGLEKYAGTTVSDQPVKIDGVANTQGLSSSEAVKDYALSHYHGVPQGLLDKFKAEPFMRSYTVMDTPSIRSKSMTSSSAPSSWC